MSQWKDLAGRKHCAPTHDQNAIAIAIKNELAANHIESAQSGIEELIEALNRADKRALKSQLIRLMIFIIKWKTQPEKRTPSWVYSIESARMEIQDLLADEPSLNSYLETWPYELFAKAKKLAEAEINVKSDMAYITENYLKVNINCNK
jgi:hypothetical protein